METKTCNYLEDVLKKATKDMSLKEYLDKVPDRSIAVGFTIHMLLCRSCSRRAYEYLNKSPFSPDLRSF